MALKLHINNHSECPIYRQISEQIAGMIRAGYLRQGEHLPPERQLALQLKIARGTVKKAYEALVQQHYIVAARGKGSKVSTTGTADSHNAEDTLNTSNFLGEAQRSTGDNAVTRKTSIDDDEIFSDNNHTADAIQANVANTQTRKTAINSTESHPTTSGIIRENDRNYAKNNNRDRAAVNSRNSGRDSGAGSTSYNTRESAGDNATERFGNFQTNKGQASGADINHELFLSGPSLPTRRHDQASQILAEAIATVESLGFSYHEINDLFGLMLAQRQEQVARFAIASVDCNPESLGIYQKQLAMLTHMSTARILLSDLRNSGSADTMLAPFDLILTTANHFEELRKMAPAMAHKVVQVIVAPTQATLIALARLDNSSRVGVLHQSSRFFSIISGWLKKSGFQGEALGFNTLGNSAAELEKFVATRSVLVVPPGFAAQLQGEQLTALNRFRSNGAQLIDFEYQIERGSLLHLEELITTLLNRLRK